LLLRHNTWQLVKKQIEFTVVLNATDREAVILHVIDRELNELKYEKLKDWFEYLNKAVRIDCPTPDEIETLAEIKATRDVLEHNAGIANDVYTTKAGRLARYRPGQRVELPDPYHRASWQASATLSIRWPRLQSPGSFRLRRLRRRAPRPRRPRHLDRRFAVATSLLGVRMISGIRARTRLDVLLGPTMQDRSLRCSRRKFLSTAAAITLSGGLAAADTPKQPDAPNGLRARPPKPQRDGRKPIAVVCTVYRRCRTPTHRRPLPPRLRSRRTASRPKALRPHSLTTQTLRTISRATWPATSTSDSLAPSPMR
jgi:hypothetical protein